MNLEAHLPVKVAVVDNHNLFRKGLVKLIETIDPHRYPLLFDAGSVREMIGFLERRLIPDVILMDIDMPGKNGYDAVEWLQEHHPQINVLVLSVLDTDEAVIRMIRLQVRGFLSKDIELDDLQRALATVSRGEFYHTELITGKVIRSIQDGALGARTGDATSYSARWASLKEQEREFARYACSELNYEQIALKMFLSPKTIEKYATNVFEKMGVKNRLGLVVIAFKYRLVALG